MKRKIHLTILKTMGLIVGLTVSATLTANATITNLAGSAVEIGAPASVMPGDLISPSIYVFDEQQNRNLPQDVPVDVVPPSRVKNPGDLAANAVIPQGSCVSSHYLHFEPGGTAATTVTGGAEFDQDILGVAVLQATLDATNLLRHPLTTYPVAADCAAVANVDCGMEVNPDLIEVTRRRVEVSFLALNPGDRIRVITECKRQGQ